MGTKIKYNFKTRKDISNPFHDMTHDELLKAAGVEKFQPGGYIVEKLENGRIIVKGKKSIKKKAH